MPVAPVVVVIENETELGRVIRDVLVDEGYDVVRVRDQYGAIGVMRAIMSRACGGSCNRIWAMIMCHLVHLHGLLNKV